MMFRPFLPHFFQNPQNVPRDCLGIPIAPGPLAKMARGIPDHAAASGLDVMHVEAMDDDVLHKLDGNSGHIVDVHLVSAPKTGSIQMFMSLNPQSQNQRIDWFPFAMVP